MSLRSASMVGLAILLAACGDESAEPAQTGGERAAEGDVLGGTISDEMLPLDTVRSQAPPLKDTGESEDEDGTASGGSSSQDDPTSQSDPQSTASVSSDPEEEAEAEAGAE